MLGAMFNLREHIVILLLGTMIKKTMLALQMSRRLRPVVSKAFKIFHTYALDKQGMPIEDEKLVMV